MIVLRTKRDHHSIVVSFDLAAVLLPAAGPDREFESDALEVTVLRHRAGSVIHIHGASFQVQSRSGGRGKLFPWESGWKDTVLLKDKESVDILIRFDGYRGRYLIHCHKLEHEDQGMMANFVVF